MDIKKLPSASDGLSFTTPTSAWEFTSWQELTSGLTKEIELYGITIQPDAVSPANDTTVELLVEIGKGSWNKCVAQIPVTFRIDTKVSHTQPTVISLSEAVLIPAYTAIRIRVADSSSSAWTHTSISIFYKEGNSPTAKFEQLLSSNFADGDATTAQLIAPSGKTSGADFQAGKMSESSNPITGIDLGLQKYTELEWNLKANNNVSVGEKYDFRISNNGTALTFYSIYPEWEIGTDASEDTSTTAGQILAESLTRSTTAGQIDCISFYTFDTTAGQIFLESHSKATTAGQIVLEAIAKSNTAGQIVIRTRTNKVVLVSPLSGFESSPVTFVWECPDNVDNKPIIFHIQVDNNSDFSSPLYEKKSNVDSGFEYWNGSSWVAVPTTGVTSSFYGNQVRIQLSFSVNEVVYWRVRGGAF